MMMSGYLLRIGSIVGGILLAANLGSAIVGEAATYYMATDGNDSSSGGEGNPFRTISRGVRVLKPGDTLYVKSGTYREALENNIPRGMSLDNPVTEPHFQGIPSPFSQIQELTV